MLELITRINLTTTQDRMKMHISCFAHEIRIGFVINFSSFPPTTSIKIVFFIFSRNDCLCFDFQRYNGALRTYKVCLQKKSEHKFCSLCIRFGYHVLYFLSTNELVVESLPFFTSNQRTSIRKQYLLENDIEMCVKHSNTGNFQQVTRMILDKFDAKCDGKHACKKHDPSTVFLIAYVCFVSFFLSLNLCLLHFRNLLALSIYGV